MFLKICMYMIHSPSHGTDSRLVTYQIFIGCQELTGATLLFTEIAVSGVSFHFSYNMPLVFLLTSSFTIFFFSWLNEKMGKSCMLALFTKHAVGSTCYHGKCPAQQTRVWFLLFHLLTKWIEGSHLDSYFGLFVQSVCVFSRKHCSEVILCQG